jgi:hypothetical protein
LLLAKYSYNPYDRHIYKKDGSTIKQLHPDRRYPYKGKTISSAELANLLTHYQPPDHLAVFADENPQT